MPINSAETLNRLAALRAKVQDGTITVAELREGILLLREDRKSASARSASARSSKGPTRSADEILAGLGSL